MIINRGKYLHELTKDMGRKDLLKPDEVENLKKCLDIALDLRKFEIELYWKRATYFWVINAAIFTFYGAIFTSKVDVRNSFLIMVSAFGILASACFYYLNRGGKFWQENWEMHTNYLSSYINGNLFQIIPKKNKDHFSVSKINLFFSSIICILWIVIFVYHLTSFMDLDQNHVILIKLWIYRLFTPLLLFIFLYYVSRLFPGYNKNYTIMMIFSFIMMCICFVFSNKILNLDLNYSISFVLIFGFVALVVGIIVGHLEDYFSSHKEKYIKFDE